MEKVLLNKYLDVLDEMGCPITTYLQNKGHFYPKISKYPIDEIIRVVEPKPKYCFYNALKVSLVFGFRYFEGYYLYKGSIPLRHAWNVHPRDGKIIDTTVFIGGLEEKPLYYYGVQVPRAVLWEYMQTNQIKTALEYHVIQQMDINNKNKTPLLVDEDKEVVKNFKTF